MTSVMLDARYLGNKPSGIGRYCSEVVAAMQRQDDTLDFRFVLRRRGDAGALRGSHNEIFDAQPYGLRTSLLLGRQLGARPADVFHSPFHVLPVGLSCATVVTMHDMFNFTQPRTSNMPFPISWLEWGYFLATIPASLRRADRVISVSRTTADLLIAKLPELRPKIRVIHHGVDPRFRRSDNKPIVGGPFMLSIGALSPNKNHMRMLEAFARAFPEPSEVRLVRVSRFGADATLLKRERELGMSHRIVSLRTPSDDEVIALLSAARALLFCSLVEGFGLPILEAMACGCPVLTSTRSCMPEVAGDAAELVDPYDVAAMARAMRRLHDEPDLRAELGARGLARAESFSWDKAAKLHRDVYAEAAILTG